MNLSHCARRNNPKRKFGYHIFLTYFYYGKTVSIEVNIPLRRSDCRSRRNSFKTSIDFQTLSITINQLQKGTSVMAERKTGTVKWFNSAKGFGFIQQQGGADLFVHANSILEGNKSLEENDKVEYTVTQGQKGPQASDVKLVR